MWACTGVQVPAETRKECRTPGAEVKGSCAVSHLGRALGQIAGPLRAEPSLQRGKILSLNS